MGTQSIAETLAKILNPDGVIGQSTVANPNLVTEEAVFEPSYLQALTGYTLGDGTKVNGWGTPAIGAASALMNGYLGMQNYNLAKDQFDFQKSAFNKNWAAQSKMTNASLADRQAARVAANPTAYQSVGDYMKQYGV